MIDPAALRLVHRPGRPLRARPRRVGLEDVLARLDRTGAWTDAPGEAAGRAFRWDARDVETSWWYPQGVTARLDPAGPSAKDTSPERRVLLTSWYGHGGLGHVLLGSRISVVDLDAEPVPRYGHVRLVQERRVLGVPALRSVPVHAGGLAWYGDHLFVAASGGGLRIFRPADVQRLRSRLRGRGTRHVLPQVGAYEARADAGVRGMVYSFISLERGPDTDHLVAGEYGRQGSGRHRLLRFPLDRSTGLLKVDAEGVARPVEGADGVPRMQGATIVDGTWFVTASSGEGNPGDLWVGRPGALQRHRSVLPTGPEDLTSWPGTRDLWTLTEWPGRRWVLRLDGARWSGHR
ncbi:hypothetical protein [Aeromicrobium sp.]|uniref:hypothetical protein n=1 Tax=Aeromicrobium sp. TaxID=1871063 RepID=UPI0025C23EA5|nr:hypothetical protein [Aeromicrobium sp.]MCK5891385.1 hypothetical protein [Aeromicrobium sp.]